MNAKLHLRYVQLIRKPDGRAYYYFRRGDVRIALPGTPGTRQFADAYDAALKTPASPIGSGKVAAGSVAAVAAAWYQAPAFTKLSGASQKTYRRRLDEWLAKAGPLPVDKVEPRHILASIEKRAATPAQANALLNVLRQLFSYAFKHGFCPQNPARSVDRLKYKKQPYATWTEEHIARFRDHWPSGTRARLALELMLNTGSRRSDAIRLGPQHLRGGALAFKQQKTGVELEIPLHPDLRAELALASKKHLAFLATERGAPFASGTGFYNWFSECAAKAGIPKGMSPHGLRKATARRLAEAGCSPHQIQAITGHKTLSEVERYTKEVEQRRLAKGAILRLAKPHKG